MEKVGELQGPPPSDVPATILGTVTPEEYLHHYRVSLTWPAKSWPADRKLQRYTKLKDGEPDWEDIYEETADQPSGEFSEILNDPGMVGYQLKDQNGFSSPLNLASTSFYVPADLKVDQNASVAVGPRDLTVGRLFLGNNSSVTILPFSGIEGNRWASPSIIATEIHVDGKAVIRTVGFEDYLMRVKDESQFKYTFPFIYLKAKHIFGDLTLRSELIPPLERSEKNIQGEEIPPERFNMRPIINASILDNDSANPVFEFTELDKEPQGDKTRKGLGVLVLQDRTDFWTLGRKVEKNFPGVYVDRNSPESYWVISPRGHIAVTDASSLLPEFLYLGQFTEVLPSDTGISLKGMSKEDPSARPDFEGRRLTDLKAIPPAVLELDDLLKDVSQMIGDYQSYDTNVYVRNGSSGSEPFPFAARDVRECLRQLRSQNGIFWGALYIRFPSINILSWSGPKIASDVVVDERSKSVFIYTAKGAGCEAGIKRLYKILQTE